MSLSWALTLQGTIDEALVEAERAVPALEGTARARMQSQRALILQRLGRLDDARMREVCAALAVAVGCA
jgi:mRNA-degrading endonuclease toxin of MazEF toxin-antitoxin module